MEDDEMVLHLHTFPKMKDSQIPFYIEINSKYQNDI